MRSGRIVAVRILGKGKTMKIRRLVTIFLAALATVTFMGPVASAETIPPSQPNPQETKAWAAFDSWLAGTTMLCVPFSGPDAWGCAVAMGFLGLMPDFNAACD